MELDSAERVVVPERDGLGPMQRWDRDSADGATLSVIVQRVADGETLKEICKSRGWPYSRVAQWVATDEVARGAYDGASAIWADGIARETVAISDEQAEVTSKSGEVFDPNVPRDNLRIKARQWAAEKLARERYGAKMQHELRVTVDLGERLRRARERVIDGVAAGASVEDAAVIDASNRAGELALAHMAAGSDVREEDPI